MYCKNRHYFIEIPYCTTVLDSSILFQDLNKDLKSELSGNFEDLILALMTPTVEYQAKEIHHALSGIGTNEQTLVELMCSATNHEIHNMRAAYERRESSVALLVRL